MTDHVPQINIGASAGFNGDLATDGRGDEARALSGGSEPRQPSPGTSQSILWNPSTWGSDGRAWPGENDKGVMKNYAQSKPTV